MNDAMSVVGAGNSNGGNPSSKDRPAVRPPTQRSTGLRKLAVAAVVVALFCTAYFQFGRYLSLEALAEKEAALIDFGNQHAVLVVGIAFLIYVTATGLSLPGAAVLTLTLGWFFKQLFGELNGYLTAFVVVSFASTSGATLAFLLSRFLLRDAVQNKFGDRLVKFNEALEREGPFYLFTLRLIPAVPFFVINVVMGLTPIRVRTYWWVSQLGMLPGTAVYVYAGWSVPGLAELAEKGTGGILSTNLIIAFALLGLFPIVVRKVMSRIRPATRSSVD